MYIKIIHLLSILAFSTVVHSSYRSSLFSSSTPSTTTTPRQTDLNPTTVWRSIIDYGNFTKAEHTLHNQIVYIKSLDGTRKIAVSILVPGGEEPQDRTHVQVKFDTLQKEQMLYHNQVCLEFENLCKQPIPQSGDERNNFIRTMIAANPHPIRMDFEQPA